MNAKTMNVLSTSHFSWQKHIRDSSDWIWSNEKLWHRNAASLPANPNTTSWLQYWFVKHIYADQNRSPSVKKALEELLSRVPQDGTALNIGAGSTRLSNVVNLEIRDAPNVDIIGYGTDLPFCDESVDLVIMQEVLEHVDEVNQLLSEVNRILKPGGVVYCQVPFQIGFHPGPSDYWRFTRQGLEHLFRPPIWRVEKIEISLGHGSGFYRIAVEFVAVSASCVLECLYKPSKIVAALALLPLKWFDLLTSRSIEQHRIPGGYFCVAAKVRQKVPDTGT